MMQFLDLVRAVARKSPLPGDDSQRRPASDTPQQPEMVPSSATWILLNDTENQNYGHDQSNRIDGLC